MEVLTILYAAFVGTGLMTIFSYLLTKDAKEFFKVPVLLNMLVARSEINLSPRRKSILGWLLHYLVGLSFVIIFHFLWKYTLLKPTWQVALLFGFLSGIIGCIAWFLMFYCSQKPPKVNFSIFFLQRFVAHFIFSFGVVSAFKIFINLRLFSF